MFLKNAWYAAGFAEDLGATPLARRICGEPVVLFRTAGGNAVALEDRCAHRGMPLSEGGVCEGEIIRCPYHGLEFDASGACTRIPGQEKIPAGARVRRYPLVERDAMLWIWMGDAGKADPGRIVSNPYQSDPRWVWSRSMLQIRAHWQLAADNLLDLSHLPYVHKSSIGGNPEQQAKAILQSQRVGDCLTMTRWVLDTDTPAQHRENWGLSGRIDRWQDLEFHPGVIKMCSGAKAAGAGAFEGNREGGKNVRHTHYLTPETERSTLYFFRLGRDFFLEDRHLTGKLHESTMRVLEEDVQLIEAQQARLDEDPGRELLSVKADSALHQARRIVEDLLAQEAAVGKGRDALAGQTAG